MGLWSKVLLCDDTRGGFCSCLGVGCPVGRGLCVEEGSLWEGAFLRRGACVVEGTTLGQSWR